MAPHRPPRTRAALRRLALCAAWAVAAAPGPAQGEPEPEPGWGMVERAAFVMGTAAEVRVRAPSRGAALAASEAALRAFEAVERRLSTWRDDTELSALNRHAAGEPFPASAELCADLERARRWWEATGGAFDPAVGALVRAYGLREGGRWPTSSELADARAATGLAHFTVDVEGRRIVRDTPEATLDAGAFGKGVALDAALRAVPDDHAVQLDLGGQLAWRGQPEDTTFDVADPRQRDRPVCRVRVGARGSLATSGNSERGLVVDGRRLGHVLDPRTGEPTCDRGSATVLADSAFDADCLSTACLVLGPEAAIERIDRLTGIDVIWIEVTGDTLRIHLTANLREHCETLVPEATFSTEDR